VKIIPIFIPHAGCPYRCIYCDQHKISGAVTRPSIKDIHAIIERNLKTISDDERVEIAFFGGTFTLLRVEEQRKYLDAAYSYIKAGRVYGIRISTHPEAVSKETIRLFKQKGGYLVELGIQSLDKTVLKRSGREMDLKIIVDAIKCIKDSNLEFGVQVMIGLPGDTLRKSIKTVETLIKFGPKTARIYPTIVLKGTKLAELYRRGRYRPLSMEEAIEWSAKLYDIFDRNGVSVIRIGLHPSRELISKRAVVAGPFHISFGEMVRARNMRYRIMRLIGDKVVPNRSRLEFVGSEEMFGFIAGHKKKEKKFLEAYYKVKVVFKNSHKQKCSSPRANLLMKDIRKTIAIIDPRMPVEAKKRLEKMGYFIVEISRHKLLPEPVRGHVDMMLFKYNDIVIYEPSLENIAELLRANGYSCIKGRPILSSKYPEDIIYNACGIGTKIICYSGSVERHIEDLDCKFIRVRQGYTKCSVIPVDEDSIITSDRFIKDAWEKEGGVALLVQPGYIKLPGYKSGFIGGATGVTDDSIVFVGSLEAHPDSEPIRSFIKKSGKKIIELYNGPLYDVGTIFFMEPRHNIDLTMLDILE